MYGAGHLNRETWHMCGASQRDTGQAEYAAG